MEEAAGACGGGGQPSGGAQGPATDAQAAMMVEARGKGRQPAQEHAWLASVGAVEAGGRHASRGMAQRLSPRPPPPRSGSSWHAPVPCCTWTEKPPGSAGTTRHD
jgi:hypothetical protein